VVPLPVDGDPHAATLLYRQRFVQGYEPFAGAGGIHV
jgi:hypothetical protein